MLPPGWLWRAGAEPERRVRDSFEAHPGIEGRGGRVDGVHDHGEDGEGLAGYDDSLQGIDEQQFTQPLAAHASIPGQPVEALRGASILDFELRIAD